jgi:hypothetical protein
MNYIIRKTVSVFLLAIIFMTSLWAAPDAANTRFYLMKTNRLLGVAQMCIKKTQNFKGDLALATRHERKAKALYEAKDFQQAIYHSKRSRDLCIKIFTENNMKPPMDAKYNSEETALAAQSPDNNALDEQLDKDSLKDEDLLNGKLNVDIP